MREMQDFPVNTVSLLLQKRNYPVDDNKKNLYCSF